jgi:acetoin utilization protein AcuC
VLNEFKEDAGDEETNVMGSAVCVYKPAYLTYDFGPGHPFSPVRWKALRDLLEQVDLPMTWVRPDSASDEDVLSVHSEDFVAAVKASSDALTFLHPGFFGLGTGDVPTFLGMHDATCEIVGGTCEAGRLVSRGSARRVLQLGGGLHHAMRSRASGFCVYNDVAVMIAQLRAENLRVAYVDVDVHHGDGVQSLFYDDPDVLTVSLHESGAYLFPGTGMIVETGGEHAPGASINIPLHPGTGDASYLECFDAVVPGAVRAFGPDVLVLEAGADAHSMDPLAHLSLTTYGFAAVFDRVIRLADEEAEGRLVAALGGGYAFDSTLRVWSVLACKLADVDVPDVLPPAWRDAYADTLLNPAWDRWHDVQRPGDSDLAEAAEETNRRTVRELTELLSALR